MSIKEKGAQAPGSVSMRTIGPIYKNEQKQSCEVAHSIVLYGCRNIHNMQVGGGKLVGWFKVRVRKEALDRLTEQSGFSCFGSLIERFSHQADHGYTYIRVLGQSAINIHTYPEEGTVSALVVTCPGEDDDGSATARFELELREHYGADSVESRILGKVPLAAERPGEDFDNWPVGCN